MPYIAPVLSLNQALLFKQEAAFGTGVTAPAVAAYVSGRYEGPALLDNSLVPVTRDVKKITTSPLRVSMTKRKDIIGRSLLKVTFDAFLQGQGGSGGLMPWWVPLLESCGHSLASGSSGGSSSWVLTPTNTPPSLTFFHHSASVRQKITGSVGSATLKIPAGDAPRFSFSFMGLWNDEENNISMPTLTEPAFLARQVELEAFTIGGYTPICPELNIDFGVEDGEREDINSAKGFYGLFQSDRNPMFDAIVERETTLTNHNPEALRQAATDTALAFTHGTVASGSTFAISAPTTQLVELSVADRNKRLCWQEKFKGQHVTDNADYSITIREKI